MLNSIDPSVFFHLGVDYFDSHQDQSKLREFTTSSKTMKGFFLKAVWKHKQSKQNWQQPSDYTEHWFNQ